MALGVAAWPSLVGQAATGGGALATLPLPQRAKRVIWLSMAGGPSHLETFDPKPKLAEMDGKPMPESLTKGQQLAQLQGPEAQVLRATAPVSRNSARTRSRSARCFPRSVR